MSVQTSGGGEERRVGREGETKRERDSQSVVVMVVMVDLETVVAQWHSTAQQYQDWPGLEHTTLY